MSDGAQGKAGRAAPGGTGRGGAELADGRRSELRANQSEAGGRAPGAV